MTQEEVVSILLSGYIPRGMLEKEYLEVKNYQQVFKYLLENNEKMNTILIKNYHKLLIGDLREDAGKYKSQKNIIIGADFETTKPYKIPFVLQEWCDNYNYRMKDAVSNEEKVRVIMEEHIKFERIQPF